MEVLDVIKTVEGLFGVLLMVIGYFLKGIHTKLEQTSVMAGENSVSIQLMQQDHNGKIDKLTEITELQIQQLTESVKNLTGSIAHMNTNVKNTDVVLNLVLSKLEEK